MNPAKIIIATAVIILFTSVLSSCVPDKTANENPTPVEIVNMAREITKEVSINLLSEIDGNTVIVKIILDNPKKKPLTSVQSWLSYNPKALRGVSIKTEDSLFEFTAPYESAFDEVTGIVMIGRGNNEPINDKSIVVAEVVFEIISEGTTMIDIYDYRQDLSGHASSNMMHEGFPYNILIKPESPALVIANLKLEI